MSQSYERWRESALCGTYTPLADDRLAEIHAATCKYGSGNCWTGTTGNLCEMIRELLREVEWLRSETTLGGRGGANTDEHSVK